MARVKSADTEPETTLRRALWQRGLRFRLRAQLPGRPDLIFPRCKVAVFVDGCFWHQCPIHATKPARNAAFWDRKLAGNVERDRKADANLAALGWRVVRVWEHEIAEDVGAVVERIGRAVLLDDLVLQSADGLSESRLTDGRSGILASPRPPAKTS